MKGTTTVRATTVSLVLLLALSGPAVAQPRKCDISSSRGAASGPDVEGVREMLARKDLPRVADEAQTIAAANAKLSEYHRERRQTLTTG